MLNRELDRNEKEHMKFNRLQDQIKEWEKTKAEYLDKYEKTLKKVGETDQLITTTKESGGKIERLADMKQQIA